MVSTLSKLTFVMALHQRNAFSPMVLTPAPKRTEPMVLLL